MPADCRSTSSSGGCGTSSAAPTTNELGPTPLQCIARRAADAPGDGKRSLPTLNVLIDHDTLRRSITAQPLDPTRYDEMVCRTQAGDPVDVTEAASLALWGHIRRVVHDGQGTVIDLGRRKRLFTGSRGRPVVVDDMSVAGL